MYKTEKTYITKEKKVIDLINENHLLLLCLEHFNIDFAVNNKTVENICTEYNINTKIFIVISNLYNGFFPNNKDIKDIKDIEPILMFLKNSHFFYIEDKYPELKNYLKEIKNNYEGKDMQLIEEFFNNYFEEVSEHLKYEDNVAFPYFYSLLQKNKTPTKNSFSANEYKTHHSDIETKLKDLKNLFLKHLKIDCTPNTKRNFLHALFDLEFDLKIHSIIEETLLIPIAEIIENNQNG